MVLIKITLAFFSNQAGVVGKLKCFDFALVFLMYLFFLASFKHLQTQHQEKCNQINSRS